MDPAIVGIFVPITGIVGFSAFMVLKVWSNHQLKMRELSHGGDERLAEAVQQLSDEVGSMQESIADLNERMDFTERMLSEVRSTHAIGPGDST